MQKNDYIGVYGTLRQGERADLRRQSHNFDVAFVGLDKVNGDIFHLGAYPGAKVPDVSEYDHSRSGFVVEVFKLKSESIIALLDAYEGYNSEKPYLGLYDRVQTWSKNGRHIWVYTYNGMVLPEQRIISGDWCKNRVTEVSGRRLME